MLGINVLLAVSSLASATPSYIGAGVAGINAGVGLGAGLGVGGGVGLALAGGVNNGAYANGGYAYGIHDTQCQTIHSKSGCPGCPDSAENSNFPQKDCLRTRKLSVSVPET